MRPPRRATAGLAFAILAAGVKLASDRGADVLELIFYRAALLLPLIAGWIALVAMPLAEATVISFSVPFVATALPAWLLAAPSGGTLARDRRRPGRRPRRRSAGRVAPAAWTGALIGVRR